MSKESLKNPTERRKFSAQQLAALREQFPDPSPYIERLQEQERRRSYSTYWKRRYGEYQAERAGN